MDLVLDLLARATCLLGLLVRLRGNLHTLHSLSVCLNGDGMPLTSDDLNIRAGELVLSIKRGVIDYSE